MGASRRERLVLTLPPDPGLARLTGLVTLCFLRQNGVGVAEASKGARTVERRCRVTLRGARRTARALVLVLAAGARALEATGRPRPGRHGRRMLHLERPGPA